MIINQILIEKEDRGFAIVLLNFGCRHPMDFRMSFEDTFKFAVYLANLMGLPVYYQNYKLK